MCKGRPLMEFEKLEFKKRFLEPFIEPVEASELQEGSIYYTIDYSDSEMMIPHVMTVVYIGKNLDEDDKDIHVFQDFNSYDFGVTMDSKVDGINAMFIGQPGDNLNNIFVFEKVLDELIRCSFRREGRWKG